MRASLLALVICCSGCVDPEADFDSFAARAKRASPVDAGGDAATCTVQPGDVAGQYLFAISVTLAPLKPIVALADLTTPPLDGGAGLALDVQPLSAADRQTPVGQKVSLGPFAVDGNGGYRAEIPNLDVTGAANPVTGADISASLVLSGNLCGDRRSFCGTVTGNVTKPVSLDLQGSTFTFTAIDSPASVPARPVIDCAGNLADPL